MNELFVSSSSPSSKEPYVTPPAPTKLTPAKPTEGGSAVIAVLAERLVRWFQIPLDVALDIFAVLFAVVPAAITWGVTQYRTKWVARRKARKSRRKVK